VNSTELVVVAVELLVGLAAPVPVGCIVMVPFIMLDGTTFIELEVATSIELDDLKPLQSPPLQRLYAHCASLEHSALKLPQRAINMALLAQHCTPSEHWLGVT
jgi:hypothetical protein